jgi:hypothetical protein
MRGVLDEWNSGRTGRIHPARCMFQVIHVTPHDYRGV